MAENQELKAMSAQQSKQIQELEEALVKGTE